MKHIEFKLEPPNRLLGINWRELWRFRDLFLAFAWRDLSVRYKQTVLGALWAILQPLIMMIVFTLIFHRMAKLESGDETPYPIFLYVGLLIWQYYSGTLTRAGESMVFNASIIQKVYFPRLLIPASTALTGLIDMAVASVILAGIIIYYKFRPHLMNILLLPLLLLSTVLSALGLGLFCASMNLKYRDVRYALPFFVQMLMYVTPVVYPVQLLDAHPVVKTLVLWLNPVSGVVSNARAGLLGKSPIDWPVLGISVGMSTVLFVLGALYFRNTERYFADIA